jgi:PEP-CTERM motif
VLQFDLTAGNQGGGGQGGGAVPEPSTVALMGAALAGLGWMRRK